nr:hypothetical protein [Tanacetum cinerariifolium]
MPPAPLQRLQFDWLQSAGVQLAILRLDLVDPLISGNKWFKLKHHLEAAGRAGARGVISLGGAHSNHLHALAAAGKRFGFATVGLMRGHAVETPTALDLQAFGMELHWLGYAGYRARHAADFWDPWRERYPHLFPVPEGGGGLDGALGCADIVHQARSQLGQLGHATDLPAYGRIAGQADLRPRIGASLTVAEPSGLPGESTGGACHFAKSHRCGRHRQFRRMVRFRCLWISGHHHRPAVLPQRGCQRSAAEDLCGVRGRLRRGGHGQLGVAASISDCGTVGSGRVVPALEARRNAGVPGGEGGTCSRSFAVERNPAQPRRRDLLPGGFRVADGAVVLHVHHLFRDVLAGRRWPDPGYRVAGVVDCAAVRGCDLSTGRGVFRQGRAARDSGQHLRLAHRGGVSLVPHGEFRFVCSVDCRCDAAGDRCRAVWRGHGGLAVGDFSYAHSLHRLGDNLQHGVHHFRWNGTADGDLADWRDGQQPGAGVLPDCDCPVGAGGRAGLAGNVQGVAA